VNESIQAIEGIIQKKVQQGTDPKRIVLIGFSQGAAVCLMVGLTTLHELAGIASLSGWIPHRIREVSVIHSSCVCNNMATLF
jgi:lysophospholipase-2